MEFIWCGKKWIGEPKIGQSLQMDVVDAIGHVPQNPPSRSSIVLEIEFESQTEIPFIKYNLHQV